MLPDATTVFSPARISTPPSIKPDAAEPPIHCTGFKYSISPSISSP